jgi:hypothetical protein
VGYSGVKKRFCKKSHWAFWSLGSTVVGPWCLVALVVVLPLRISGFGVNLTFTSTLAYLSFHYACNSSNAKWSTWGRMYFHYIRSKVLPRRTNVYQAQPPPIRVTDEPLERHSSCSQAGARESFEWGGSDGVYCSDDQHPYTQVIL